MVGSGTGDPITASASFVVEDGTGKTDANSYCSVADADTYHATYTGSTDWSGATQAAKERALVQATQYLDGKYGNRWRGYRAHGYPDDSTDQALDWPRVLGYDADGWPYDDDTLPTRLQQATAEMALRFVLGDDPFAAVTEQENLSAESVTVGPVSESKTYRGAKGYGNVYPKIDALVAPLISPGGAVIRG